MQQLIKSTVTLVFIFSTMLISEKINGQNIGINSTGTSPDASAGLDVSYPDKGLLIPRVALTAANSASPIVSPATSLIIYNTATAGSVPNDVTPGYYFWDGSVWKKVCATNTTVNIIDDLRVTIDKGTNSAQLGSLTGIAGPEIWFFRNGSGVEAMSFTLQLPHNWKAGTTIYPHIHWVPKTSGAGNVQWNLDYTWADLNEATPATFPAVTTSSVIVTGPFTINQHLLSDLTAGNIGIDGTGKNYSSILICRIWRDSGLAGDTYNGDAGGLSIDFHISLRNVFSE